MRKLLTLLVGVLLGALSWGMAYAVSGTFEPFDSGIGFLVTQIVLSSAALLVGTRTGAVDSVVLVAGGYVGMNVYSYAFGASEAQAWAVLGLITTTALVLVPALGGLLGGIARYLLARHRRRAAKQV